MGYAVYEDEFASDYGVVRWAGYGVPAICDMPGCETKIDRGMGYRCESGHNDGENVTSISEDDPEFADAGCGLHFCEEHRYDTDAHKDAEPKPDTPQWEHHILRDSSWEQWREINARLIPEMEERTKDYQCNEDCDHD